MKGAVNSPASAASAAGQSGIGARLSDAFQAQVGGVHADSRSVYSMGFTRRQFLGATGAAAAPLVVGACGFTGSDSSADAGSDTLTFTTWGTDSELAGFRNAIARFTKAEPNAKVSLNAVPYEQMFTNIDAQIQAGRAPDIFRVPYYTFGSYAGRGQLLDLTGHVDSTFGSRFTPAAWRAVQNNGKPFGVPHHTDTSAVYYNKAALTAAGITSVPSTPAQAWTWDEFTAVAQKLRTALPAAKFPFAYNWQGNGVTRWLSLLFEADGRFLAEDLVTRRSTRRPERPPSTSRRASSPASSCRRTAR
jgi:multiple sugar transport system substrate-binding protein